MALLTEAIRWYTAGYMPVPLRPDGTKAPAVDTWRDYQWERPDLKTVLELFKIDSDGIGLICGQASGQLELFELEGRAIDEGYLEKLEDALKAHDLGGLLDIISSGYVELTPGGGLHFYYRVDGKAKGNTRLARRPATEAELAENPKEKLKVLIETRGQGGFTVIAPSAGRSHPTGRAWEAQRGTGPESIPVITEEQRDALYAITSTLDEVPVPDHPKPQRSNVVNLHGEELRPGDEYNAITTWAEILEPAGWTIFKHYGGNLYGWQRPGKRHAGLSATTGRDAEADRLYVFSTATEFEPEKPYSKFAAYAVLNHGGDYSAAARALRLAGRGDPDPLSPSLYPKAGAVGGHEVVASVTSIGVNAVAPDGEVDKERTSWWPEPIADRAAAFLETPTPNQLRRDDGQCLFYSGKVNGIIGESESGKSWIALLAVVQALIKNEHVLILDFEDSPSSIHRRLLQLGVDPDKLPLVHYADPDESYTLAQRNDLSEALGVGYSVIVVDGINAAMTLLGYDLNSNTDATLFATLLLRPLAHTRACVITVDHVPKNPDGRNKGGIGAQAKRAMITGCQLVAEVVDPFGKGQDGSIKLLVDKDKNGIVRGISSGGKYAGKAVVASTADSVRIHITAPVLQSSETTDNQANWEPTIVMEKISRLLEGLTDPISYRSIEQQIGGKKPTITRAVDVLRSRGFIDATSGSRNSLLHRSVRPYRAAESSLSPTVPRVSPGDGEESVPTVPPHPIPTKWVGGQGDTHGSAGTDDRVTVPQGTLDIPGGYSHCNQCGQLATETEIELGNGICIPCQEGE